MRPSNAAPWLAVIGAILAASCSPAAMLQEARPTAATAGGRYAIATAAPQADLLSLFDGTVNAQVKSDGSACLWIDWRATRTAMLWPRGYTARGNPVTVYDGEGKQVLVAGQKLIREGVQFPVGGGQVLSSQARTVKGCSGFSQSVAFVPTPSRGLATPGPEEYDELQIGKMQSVVDTYREVFGGMVGDPGSHVMTIYVASTADPASVARAKTSLFTLAAASDGFGSITHWRVGFVVEGPSLATLDGALHRLEAQPWRKDVGAQLMSWGLDPALHKARIGVLEITPTISADARAAFGNLAVLETAEPAIAN